MRSLSYQMVSPNYLGNVFSTNYIYGQIANFLVLKIDNALEALYF